MIESRALIGAFKPANDKNVPAMQGDFLLYFYVIGPLGGYSSDVMVRYSDSMLVEKESSTEQSHNITLHCTGNLSFNRIPCIVHTARRTHTKNSYDALYEFLPIGTT